MMHLRRQIRDIGIEALLAWTFGAQHAQLEAKGHDDARGAFGTEWVIYQRGAVLGCAIDGGRGYLPDPEHDDAETVAAVVSGALQPQVARWVADLARAGRRPDALICTVPQCLPRAKRDGRYGSAMPAMPDLFAGGAWELWMQNAARSKNHARRYPLTPWEVEHRRFLGRCTPVTYEPTRQQVDTARAAYLEWWAALHEVRERLAMAPVLRDHRLTRQMPPVTPWETEDARRGGHKARTAALAASATVKPRTG